MKKRGGKIFHLLWILFLTAGFFVLPKIVLAGDSDIKPGDVIINEVMWMGSKDINNPSYDGPKDQWIELKNVSGKDVSFNSLYLTFKNASTGNENKLAEITNDKIIKDGEYFLLTHYKEANSAINKEGDSDMNNFNFNTSTKTFDFSKFQIKLYFKDALSDILIDTAGDGKSIPSGKGDAVNFYSMERNDNPKDGGDYNNWHTCLDADSTALYWDSGRTERGTPTPSEKEAITDEKSPYAEKIKINEIRAETSDEEFIEIINNTKSDIDLSGWCIKDEIKYNKSDWDCKKPSSVKQNADFYTLFGSFSLNNDSGGDTVYLYDENKKLVDSVSYKDAKSGYSYAYDTDSSAWRWTSKKTPGAKNEFDKILSGKIKKDDPVYVGIYADFSVDADSDVEKFTWDFGDGHKSYLKETKHKYEKKGEYDGSLEISGNGEASQYFFTVKVEKYKAPKIRIASFSPNPKGVDTKKEWIEIENKSKKKINLNGWSIAMGWDNLVNHPIREDFILKSGKSKKLTQKICAFTLNNTKTKIEFRDPSGKIVQKIKYDRTSNKIEEDEIYEKTENGWQWANAQTSTDEKQTNKGETQTSTDEVPANEAEMQNDTENAAQDNAEESTVDKEIQMDDIEENPQVLGAEEVKNSENIETLNIKSDDSNHGKQKFFSSLIWGLNQKMSTLMNFIINHFS